MDLTLGPNYGNGASTLGVNPSKGCNFFSWDTKPTCWNAGMCDKISYRVWNWLWWVHQHLVVYIFECCFPFNSSRLHQLKWISYFLPRTSWREKGQKDTWVNNCYSKNKIKDKDAEVREEWNTKSSNSSLRMLYLELKHHSHLMTL